MPHGGATPAYGGENRPVLADKPIRAVALLVGTDSGKSYARIATTPIASLASRFTELGDSSRLNLPMFMEP